MIILSWKGCWLPFYPKLQRLNFSKRNRKLDPFCARGTLHDYFLFFTTGPWILEYKDFRLGFYSVHHVVGTLLNTERYYNTYRTQEWKMLLLPDDQNTHPADKRGFLLLVWWIFIYLYEAEWQDLPKIFLTSFCEQSHMPSGKEVKPVFS